MSRSRTIQTWEPEDAAFWAAAGRRIADRNMWTSVFGEHIGFCVWSLWSVLVLFMTKKSGYPLSPGDKFLLVSLVTLVGAANFASSTTNVNFFFPEREKGRALGINAGGGNLGVASVQLLGLLVIAAAGAAHPRTLTVIFIPLLLAAALLACTLMDNLPGMRTGGTVYRTALRDPHCWTISLLYTGTFGSFIGYSFAFGLVLQNDFGRTPLQAAGLTFIGPLLGSLTRPFGGYLADRFGPARITLISFTGMFGGTAIVIAASTAHSLPLFTVALIALFVLSGLGNGSTYAMIPAPYAAAAAREIADGADATAARLAARRKAGAVIAFAGTVGGLGGVAINLAFRQSYLTAHNPRPALFGFLACYAVCAAVTALASRRRPATVPVPARAAA